MTIEPDPTTPEGALAVWVAGFNEGDLKMLRSVYTTYPQNEIMLGGSQGGLEAVLSFNEFMHRRNAHVALVGLNDSYGGEAAIELQADIRMDIVPWTGLAGTLRVGLIEDGDEYRVDAVYIDHPMEVIMNDVFGFEPSRELPDSVEPLPDMSPDDTYHGEGGGLYGDHGNTPPTEHRSLALTAIEHIEPLDEDGHPSNDGKIGFVSHGMSFTNMYFQSFMDRAWDDPRRSPAVTPFNGAHGFLAYSSRSLALGGYPLLALNTRLVHEADLSPAQVQVAWVQPTHFPTKAELDEPMVYSENLHGYLRAGVRNLKANFPNLQVVYISDRPYQSFGQLNGEPVGYEIGFAVRNTILDQVEGDTQLNADPDSGPVEAPVLLWGPYLWTHGATPRADGFAWSADYFGTEGTHPSPLGTERFAEVLLEFLHTDELASPWYTRTN